MMNRHIWAKDESQAGVSDKRQKSLWSHTNNKREIFMADCCGPQASQNCVRTIQTSYADPTKIKKANVGL